jgi:hypothetical protein
VFVCKSWKHPAQTMLYGCSDSITSRNVEKFVDTVEKNQCLGKLVKSFNLQSSSHKSNVGYDSINLFERIFQSCPSLREISLDSKVNKSKSSSTIALKHVAFSTNIRSLKCTGNVVDISSHISYIIHEFPHLDDLPLHLSDQALTLLDPVTQIQVMPYLPKIKNIDIDQFKVNPESIADTLGYYWEPITDSRSAIIELQFDYIHASNMSENVVGLTLKSSDKVLPYPVTLLQYSSASFKNEVIRIIRRYGKLIKKNCSLAIITTTVICDFLENFYWSC